MTDPKSGAGSVAIKKHRHKYFEGPEMVRIFFPLVLRARPGNVGFRCQRDQNQQARMKASTTNRRTPILSSKNKQTSSKANKP